jgi:hypothetical protein
MGHLFPGGTKPTSGSEFRSRVVFRLMWCPLSHPPPLRGRCPSWGRGGEVDEEGPHPSRFA